MPGVYELTYTFIIAGIAVYTGTAVTAHSHIKAVYESAL